MQDFSIPSVYIDRNINNKYRNENNDTLENCFFDACCILPRLSQTDSVIRRTLKLPLNSIVVEMVNNTDSTCMTGEAYTIEQRVNDVWTILPIKPRKDGAVYAFNDIGYELAPHSTRLFTIHVDSDKYDFERGQEYRIVKEFFKKGKKEPQSVYCNFTIE